ncbi:VOC family protein [Nakamurella sp. GG22]
MSVTTTTHLNFRGDARAALDFYRSVFGGSITAFSYRDAHNVGDPSEADQLMWGELQGEDVIHLMAYDVPGRTAYDQGVNSFFVSVRGSDAEEIRSYWNALAVEATIVADLAPALWAPLYGMLRDRFGVVWVLDVAGN